MDPLKKFKAMVGKDTAEMGILVCRVEKNTPMPSDTLAIPWHKFPKWLKSKLKTQPPEVRNHWSGEIVGKDLEGVSEGKKREKLIKFETHP